MNLTKNQIYIISAIAIAVIIYFVFFRKKATKVVMAPAVTPPAKSAESGYFGQQWNWGSGPQQYTVAEQMNMMSGGPGNSVASTMENGYVAKNEKWPNTIESNYVTPAMRKAGSGTNFLFY